MGAVPLTRDALKMSQGKAGEKRAKPRTRRMIEEFGTFSAKPVPPFDLALSFCVAAALPNVTHLL